MIGEEGVRSLHGGYLRSGMTRTSDGPIPALRMG